MIMWIIRVSVIVASPIIAWFQVDSSAKGILVGVGIGIMIIAAEIAIQSIALDTLIFAVIGSVVGLVFSLIIEKSAIFILESDKIEEFFKSYSFLFKLVMTYLGMIIAVHKKSELDKLDRDILVKGPARKSQDVKILDTSAIIDGRIADVCETEFLSGILIVPEFVLRELQAVADSADDNKRVRGRRGLDMLKRIQESSKIPVKIYEIDFPQIREVDAKLVHLAKELKGKIITTDFNLNKIAAIHGVPVININDLAQFLKPVVLPGEKMTVFIVKEGKERSQGIGYLDDGTMVVIEEAKQSMGKRVEVHVNSILQTSAGRMIFGRLREQHE